MIGNEHSFDFNKLLKPKTIAVNEELKLELKRVLVSVSAHETVNVGTSKYMLKIYVERITPRTYMEFENILLRMNRSLVADSEAVIEHLIKKYELTRLN